MSSSTPRRHPMPAPIQVSNLGVHSPAGPSGSSSRRRSPVAKPKSSHALTGDDFRSISPSNPVRPSGSHVASFRSSTSGGKGGSQYGSSTSSGRRFPWGAALNMVPPNIRRLFSSAQVVTVAILTAVILLWVFHRPIKEIMPFMPHSYHYPIRPQTPIPSPIHLTPLPAAYADLLSGLALPSVLLSPQHEALAKRLHAFLHRPIWSHDEGQEIMAERCPPEISDLLVNPDQLRGDGDFWKHRVDRAEVIKRRVQIVDWLKERVEQGQVVLGGELEGGRGIVLTAGNQDTTLRTLTLLRLLKRAGNTLPIEVFHYDDELHDRAQRRELEELGATLRVISGVTKQAGAWKVGLRALRFAGDRILLTLQNWQIKGLAIIESSFREVLSLDSDNTPIRSVEHLFDAPLYRAHGAVFWPDLSKDHYSNAIFRIMGEPCTLDHFTFESGQILIDKAGNDGFNLAALWIAAGMQGDREFWFKMCGGDKDTFRWGFRALGIEWSDSPRWMSALGFHNQQDSSGRFCGHTTLQYDIVIPDGLDLEPPLFVHSNLIKHLGGFGLGRGSTFPIIKRMHDDRYSAKTLNYARMSVYEGHAQGMCLDLEWHDSLADKYLTEQDKQEQSIEEVSTRDVEGNVFEGFEDAWFDNGGRIGGW